MTLNRSSNLTKRILALSIAMLIMLLMFAGCSSSNTSEIKSTKDLNGRRIGILKGTLFEDIAYQSFPMSNVAIFDTYSDLIANLEAGKIDTFFADDPVAKNIVDMNPGLEILNGFLDQESYGPIFAKTVKGLDLCSKFNIYLSNITQNGDKATLQRKWLNSGVEGRTFDFDPETLEAANGVIHVAAFADVAPFVYIKDNGITGFEIELLYNFCKEYRFGLDIEPMSADSMFLSVETCKVDMAIGLISHAPEREELFYFSSPEYVGGAVAVLKSATVVSSGDLLDKVALSFEKTFVREGRWLMFARGIGVTVLISLAAAFLGTILGYVIYTLVYHATNRKPESSKFFTALATIVKRTPMVVLLMFLYYVVFGSIDVSGIVVAIIAFTISFTVNQASMLNDAVESIGSGPADAAISLGYTEMKAYFRYILPLACKKSLPAYRDELINLIQGTAVVGYIAVEDLTRISDLVRSRSYESLFPLLATALIYLLLAWLLVVLVRQVSSVFEPRKRTPDEILKGVEKK